MVDEFLSEDEQAEALKTWWRQNWLWVFSGITLGLAILLGWQHYQRYTLTRALAAATALQDYVSAMDAKDQTKADGLLKDLQTTHTKTLYTDQAQLLHAKTLVEAGDFETAISVLQAVSKTATDGQLAKVAQLRLARVLSQQGQYDEALAALNFNPVGTFAYSAHEIRGDIYFYKGDTANAVAEYQAALAAFTPDMGDQSLLQLKLQDLHTAATPAATGTEPVTQATP